MKQTEIVPRDWVYIRANNSSATGAISAIFRVLKGGVCRCSNWQEGEAWLEKTDTSSTSRELL